MRKTNVYTDNSFKSLGLKTFLHSKRANIYYLQYYRVLKKDGRVLYLTKDNKANQSILQYPRCQHYLNLTS